MSIRDEIIERLCRSGVSQALSEGVLDVLVEAGYVSLAKQPNSSRQSFRVLGPTDKLVLALHHRAEDLSLQETYRSRQSNISCERLAVQHRSKI